MIESLISFEIMSILFHVHKDNIEGMLDILLLLQALL